jgi:hypothetical protein
VIVGLLTLVILPALPSATVVTFSSPMEPVSPGGEPGQSSIV